MNSYSIQSFRINWLEFELNLIQLWDSLDWNWSTRFNFAIYFPNLNKNELDRWVHLLNFANEFTPIGYRCRIWISMLVQWIISSSNKTQETLKRYVTVSFFFIFHYFLFSFPLPFTPPPLSLPFIEKASLASSVLVWRQKRNDAGGAWPLAQMNGAMGRPVSHFAICSIEMLLIFPKWTRNSYIRRCGKSAFRFHCAGSSTFSFF